MDDQFDIHRTDSEGTLFPSVPGRVIEALAAMEWRCVQLMLMRLACRAGSALVVLDPLATGCQRAFISLDDALTTRPRHRGYADVVSRLLEPGA